MNTRYPELNLDLTYRPVGGAPRHFTAGQIDRYNRDGFIDGITLYEGAELAALRDFFTRDKARIVAPAGAFQSYHHVVPELRDVVTQPRLVAYLQDLLGEGVVCHVSQYVCKEPGEDLPVVWHQDASFNPMDARSVVVWLAVDDAFVENGCMWFVPGSHRLGGLDFQGAGHAVPEVARYGEAIPIPAQAGQAVFFSDLLLHSSLPNRSSQRRGGFTMTFTSTDTQPHYDWKAWSVICAGEDRQGFWSSE